VITIARSLDVSLCACEEYSPVEPAAEERSADGIWETYGGRTSGGGLSSRRASQELEEKDGLATG